MYFIKQHQIRQYARNVLINDFHMSYEDANSASKFAQLEPVPKWLSWLRRQEIRFSNLIHFGEFSLR